ncbi:diguanylate cyclase [Thiomicrorhabdus sp. ZW0627]|uniref:GGDEF domain-containing response regulator n=1 Tax=Thiomicrorhabdus sp. ZW0627 TaxID=3039774 RepID=UPI0024364472|nr:diguanylate cyclase [Thiomicrorhabdus sp. ZW0627]MDG6773112.1 diguanylate cyclase [Thiomicrorhabdus sp. ZW0627]
MNILIVDTSAIYRKVVSELLNNDDISISEASNAKEALEYLEHETPNAISVAHELGDMNSFEFLEKINNLDRFQSVPKFLITSNVSKEFKLQAYDAGFTEIFVKSDFKNLKRAMKSLLYYATVKISAKVLYVEDAQSTADYTMHIMKNAGWIVTHVKSGEAAAELLEEQKFDLVVTDLVLEGQISGIGLIHLIRQGREDIRNTPILAVSGWNDLLRQVYVLKHGAGDFIAKPFHETDFLARAINLIMNKQQLDASIASQKALHDKVNLDPLSGLNNRHYIDEFGERLVKQALVQSEPIALCVIDIDYFKQINDLHGHAIGDEVLRQIGDMIRENSHPRDVSVRYGGDEMVIIMPNCGYSAASFKAEQLRKKAALLKPDGIDISVTIGVSCVDKNRGLHLVELMGNIGEEDDDLIVDFNTLFEAADQSLYIAKKAGRNRVCINKQLLD